MMMINDVTIIVGCDLELGIGNAGKIPWNSREDLQWFRKCTIGKTILMGRKTYESIGRLLPGRQNIILSRTLQKVPGAEIFHSIEHFIEYWQIINGPLFVIGGQQIYELMMPYVTKMYISQFPTRHECDTHFPITDEFKLINHDVRATFTILEYIRDDTSYAYEDPYHRCLQQILYTGADSPDRTGTGTKCLFGLNMKFNLRDNFVPLLTTKRVYSRGSILEMLFFLTGSSDSSKLSEQSVHIWEGNTSREFLDNKNLSHYPVGDMGPSYSFNFRHFGAEYGTCLDDYEGKGIDQWQQAIDLIKNNPESRRIVISLWNPACIDQMALPPCLHNYQFYPCGNELSLMITMRSADMFLGVPFNIFGASVLLHIMCKETGYVPGDLIVNIGNAHIYNTHVEQVKEQLSRSTRPTPKLYLDGDDTFHIIGYFPHKRIAATMAI